MIRVYGTGDPAVSVERLPGIPTTYDLHENYPNPFNPSTTFRYQIPERSRVSLKIYSLLGRVIETIVQGEQDAGYYEAHWTPRAASGVYFSRLEAGTFVQTRKLVVLK